MSRRLEGSARWRLLILQGDGQVSVDTRWKVKVSTVNSWRLQNRGNAMSGGIIHCQTPT